MFLINWLKWYIAAGMAISDDMVRREREAEFAGEAQCLRIMPRTTLINIATLVPPLARYLARKLL